MHGIHKMAAVLWLTFTLLPMVRGQTVRLVSGSSVQGDVVAVTDDGLQVKTPTGVRTFTWDSLAPSTRFRYQLVFRANYDAVLRGIPRQRWANSPDPVLDSELRAQFSTGAESVEAPKSGVQPTTPAAPAWPLIFDDISYESVPPMESSAFPNATFRNLEYASFVGFQYGGGSKEVLYMAFDTSGPKDPSDVLYVYSPGTSEFAGTVRVKGFKRGSGSDLRVTYRKLRVQTMFGKTQAMMEFEPETTGLVTNELLLTINVDLIRDKTKSRFILFRRITDLQHGEGPISVRGVIDMPNLWMGCRVLGGNPEATLLLSMGNMNMVPRDGMDTRVTLTVADDTGQVVYRDNAKMDLFPPIPEGVTAGLRRMVPAKTYKVTASMNLGPFLGAVEASEALTMPAK